MNDSLQGIAEDVERSKELMLSQLVQQLQGSIALPACLHLVGLMRRMGVFNETQLRLKFLQVKKQCDYKMILMLYYSIGTRSLVDIIAQCYTCG